MDVNVENHNYILTGGSSGIGLTLLKKLVSEGANILFSYNSMDACLIDGIIEKLKVGNHQVVVAKQLDVSKEESVKDFFNYAYSLFSNWDVLISNAGITKDSSIEEMSYDTWKEVLEVDLNGSFLCTKYFINNNFCKSQYFDKDKKIIIIGSIQGQNGSANQSNYTSAKSALIGFTKSAAIELSEKHISVNLVCPGFISTNLNCAYPMKLEKARKQSLLPIEQNLETLVNFILYLSSELCTNITGQVFNIDSRLVRN